MSCVNEAWAAIVASVTGGALALVGGYYGSRRQTIDQADVEHDQWLRGQRQEACLTLLDAWDTAMRDLAETAESWDDQLYGNNSWRLQGHTFSDVINAGTHRVKSALERPLERTHLLGSPQMEEAVDGLRDAFDALTGQLARLAAKEENATPDDWEPWEALQQEADQARKKLVSATKAAMTARPRPGT